MRRALGHPLCQSIMFLRDWMASCDGETWSFRERVEEGEQSYPLRSVPREHPKAPLHQGAWDRQTLPQSATSFPSPCENPLGSLAGSLLGKTQHYFIFKGLEYSACLWPLSASALFVALPSKVIVHILWLIPFDEFHSKYSFSNTYYANSVDAGFAHKGKKTWMDGTSICR